ncbi:MAG TPA: hypothetical protein VFC53_09645 [Dehalococcoidia bacterium]|jgi:hypothetical protein|nr:hypothetical protein [Dehalococcoidia bacterium]
MLIATTQREEERLDADYRIDVSEVTRNLDVAEVVALYFPMLRKTLLMDVRTNEVDGPMIRVVPMAKTPEERFQSLLKMRPRFGKPDSITIIPWPKFVHSLADLGVWDHIVKRYVELGYPQAVRDCERCFNQLARFEADEMRNAITGENYETIWGKPGVREAEALAEGADEDDDEDDDVFDEDE